MTTYYCKCGRIVRKSTSADNTGNRLEGYAPGHECFGCPYVMPWGENRYEEGKGFHLEVKGYECRMSQSLEYASRFSGSFSDKRTCSIVSLDFDFLERVSNWIAGTYPGGELFGGFDRSRIRAVEYCSNGRYRMTVTCAQNKAGVAAKAALLEQFFNPDGSRRDMTPEQEQEKILNDIKAATKEKEATPCAASQNHQNPTPAAAPSQSPGPGTAPGACTGTNAPGGRMEQAPTCNCMTCTCTGCHEECFGHCHGCGKPVRSCNSFQTGGEKHLVRPADAGGSKLYLKKDSPLVYRFSGSGQFQFWLFNGKQEWKPSDFLNLTYARENRENLKPPSRWLDEYAAAHGWREITQEEFDAMCKNMNAPTGAAAATTEGTAAEAEETLTTSASAEGAKTSQAWTSGATGAASSLGQHSLAGTAPATQSLSDAAAACLEAEPAERPGFDYSGMSARTVDTLHVAERMIREARRDYVIAVAQAVSIAHEELCGGVVQNLHNSKHGNRGEAAFCAWCASVGVGRRTAYNLLQVDALMQGATPEEQAVLEQASPSLLYAAAKPSAPAELVQGVKEGSITTHKQYQELQAQLKAEKDRAQTAEAQRDAALADVDGLSQRNARLQEERDSAEKRASETEKQLEGSRQVAAAEHSRAEHWKEKAEAITRQASAAPIEAKVVDTDEVERLAAEKAEALAAQQMAQRDAKDARDAYDAVILATRSMDAAWQALAPMLPRLAPEEKSQAIHQFVQKLMCIKEDVLKCL